MKARFNERKRQILEMLSEHKMTPRELAARTGIKERTANGHLLRLKRRGLLDRATAPDLRKGNRGRFTHRYWITEKGRAKLSVLAG